MNPIWHKALEFIQAQVNAENFTTYFEPLHFVELTGNTVQLEVGDAFFRDWIQDHYIDVIRGALLEVAGEVIEVSISVSERTAQPKTTAESVLHPTGSPTPTPISTPARSSSKPRATASAEQTPTVEAPAMVLNPSYTFDTFVVGDSNQFAHAACESVANHPAGAYNPLFIYGGTGLGKTHLLFGIAHRIREKNPGARIAYVSAEEFTNQVIDGIRRQEMDRFRTRYRTQCDILLMDDVHVLAGRDRTQDEFFHTFNALHQSHRQIVLTSDKFPQEIPGLEERLRSRFEWGLIADIKPPELETRVAIIRRKAERDHIDIPDDVAFFLAKQVRSNVRMLEGALIRLAALGSLTGRTITRELVKEALSDVFGDLQRGPSIDGIQKLVAEYFDVKVADLKGPRRHRAVSHPRSIAMYLCRKHVQASYPVIGSQFGHRDHTSVLHAFRKIERVVTTDTRLRADIEAIERKLHG